MQLCSTHVHNIYAGQCKYCEEENLSFKDMFLEAHGMETKKEERVDMQKKLEEFEAVSTEAQKLMNQLPLPRCVLSNDPKVDARVKALELALCKKNQDVYTEGLIYTAKRFYTYITKGE